MWWQRPWTVSYFCEEIPHLLSDLLFHHVPRPKSSRTFLRKGVFEFILWACACLSPAESGCYYSTLKNCLASAHVNIYLTTDLPSCWTKQSTNLSFFLFPILHPPPLLGRLSMRSAHQHLPSNGHVEKDLCHFPLSLFKHHKWHVWVDESWC